MKEKLVWTPERDARLIELVAQEPTIGRAAAKMGLTINSASARLYRLGYHKRLLQKKEKRYVA